MSNEGHLVYLGLGSNIQPDLYLPKAIRYLQHMLEVVQVSSIWQTPAVGMEGPDFLNVVIEVRTELNPEEIKKQVTQKIENELGRVRTEDKFAPRTIDIDLLIYDNQVLDEEIWDHAHLAVPLAELIPDLVNDKTNLSLKSIADQFQSTTMIKPCLDLYIR